MSSRLKNLLITFCLLVVILIVFYPSLHYDFVEFDDNALVVRNPDIKVLEPARILELFRRSYITLYVPVTMLSYAVDYQIWHLTPFGFKFTNLVLHFLNVILVFYLLRTLEKNSLFAWGAALLFALHPVQIESVVWVAERKNLLSTLFLLLALGGYLKAVRSFSPHEERKWLFLSLLAYVVGLLSKPSTVVFVLLIAILNYFFLGGSFAFRRRFFFYLGLLVFAVLFTVITIVGTAGEVERYRYHGGSFWVTFIIMMTVFWRYVGLLFFPYGQNILYGSPKYISFFSPLVLASAIGLVLFILIIFFIRRRNQSASFWFSWFFVSLLPVSNLVAPLPSLMNDRYLYVPLIGFFGGLLALMRWISKGRLFGVEQGRARLKTYCCIVILTIPFVILTLQRLPEWKNAESLWAAAFRRSPKPDPRIYYFSGLNQMDLNNYDRAIELLSESLKLDETIDTRQALGTAYVAAEKLEEGEFHLKKVIEKDPMREGVHDQLGVLYRKKHQYEESERSFKKAMQLAPRNAVILNNYALLKMDTKHPDEAKKIWEDALRLDPDCHFALRNMSWFHFLRGEWEEAVPYLVRYLRRSPTDRQMLDMAKKIQNYLDFIAQKSGTA